MRPVHFDVVRIYDPVVVEHCAQVDIVKYARDRDLSLLKLPPEAKPLTFRCRLLTRQQCRDVQRQTNDADVRETAALYGIEMLINVPNGEGHQQITLDRDRSTKRITDDALDAYEIGPNDLQEVGEVIARKSFLGRTERLRCALLATSEHALVTTVIHVAERKQASETLTDESSS